MKKALRFKTTTLCCFFFLVSFLNSNAQTTYYVDGSMPDNSGAGTTWSSAKRDVQEAINIAVAGDEVWVKAGTYMPTRDPFGNPFPIDPRDLTFFIRDGIKLYGGFAGIETLRSERNANINITVLSGDIGFADVTSDNSYHVALASAASGSIGITMDGFTLVSGNANNLSGTLNVNSNLIAKSRGAGLYMINSGNNIINNNIFTANNSFLGGGIYEDGAVNTLFNGNIIFLNNANGEGGGLYAGIGTHNTLTNNIINSNTASNVGGGIYSASSSVNALINNTITANSISNNAGGGGIYTAASSNNSFRNNIFWANQMAGSSGVAGADYYAVFANNNFQNNLLQLPNASYNSANNNDLGASPSGNIFAQDPFFADPSDIDGPDNIYRTADDGFHLTDCSPAYNTGTNTGAPSNDITGTSRPQYGTTDMGAYESAIVINPPPASYNVTGGNICEGGTVTVGLTGSSIGVTYQLQLNGVNVVGQTRAGTGSAISFDPQSATGIYTVEASNGFCTKIMNGSASIAAVFDDLNATTYIIYANKEVKFGEDNVIGGDVGVTSPNGSASFKKGDQLNPFKVVAKNISVQQPSNVSNTFYTPATNGPNPPFLMYNGTGGSGNFTATTDGAVTGNYENLTIKKGIIATITGNDFGKITIEEGASATFTSSTVNIRELLVKKGKKGVSTTSVSFTNPTSFKVRDRVTIEEDSYVNVGGPKVTVYLGDTFKDEENFVIRGDNSFVTMNIIIPNGKLKVSGGTRQAIITGWHIIEKLESDGKNISWKRVECTPSSFTNRSLNTPEDDMQQPTISSFAVKVLANPTINKFSLQVLSPDNQPIDIKVTDVNGVLRSNQTSAAKSSTISFGSGWEPGVYFAEVTQGAHHELVKLVKLR